MNLEQRAKRMEDIRKAEGLLAYAVSHGDEAEAGRLRAELARMLEDLWTGASPRTTACAW